MSGFEREGMRVNVRAILRRLEALAGTKPPLFIVDSDWSDLARDAAAEEGWPLAGPPQAEAVLSFRPGDPAAPPSLDRFPSAALVCHVGPSDQAAGPFLPGGFLLATRRPFKAYATLNHLLAALPGASRLPASLRRAVAAVWRGLGLDSRVGARLASLPCPGHDEIYLLRKNGPLADRAPAEDSWKDRAYGQMATFFGTGHLPIVGATVASLIPALLALATWSLAQAFIQFWLLWFAVMLLATAGCLATERWAMARYLAKDPREVVLDETAGMAMTLLFLPEHLWQQPFAITATVVGIAFLSFRFFDILKIGVRWIDRADWPGSIVWDDLLAGFYAGLVTAGAAMLLVPSGGSP